MPRKINYGDIIEIPTANGLAYAQYTLRHEEYGALIRILDGFFQSRPQDFTGLVNRRHKFVTFFPLSAAVNLKIFNIVGHSDIPDKVQTFPLVNSEVPLLDRKSRDEWQWGGDRLWRIGALSAEKLCSSRRELVNSASLALMIESGWTVETGREN